MKLINCVALINGGTEMKKVRKVERKHATKIFTDREEPRQAFWKNYFLFKERMNEGNICVLSYYGIGGIGKSALLKKLIDEIQEAKNKPKVVSFDFNTSQDTRTVLESLKNQLIQNYNFEFPLFEIGLYIYARKIGENMDAPEIKSFIDRSPKLKFMLEAVGIVPAVSFIPSLIKIADKGVAFIRNLLRNHKHELINIENLDPTELFEHLTYLFSQDLTDNLKDEKDPLVIMFDTYEKLVNEMLSVGEPLNNDLWIRGDNGLIQNTPKVLWVIAGREKLKWDTFDTDWKDSLDTHILGNLSKQDSISFLKDSGIKNIELCNDLYGLTQGTPVYLDLCIDRYYYVVEKGKQPKIEDFGKNIYTLIERFARYMDDSKKDIVYILCCLGTWNDEILLEIAPLVFPNFSLTAYEKVKNFSFITKSNNNTYTIHQIVSESLYQNCPFEMKKRIESCVLEFCKKKIAGSRLFSPKYAFYINWLVKYALQTFKDDHELKRFFISYLEQPLKDLSKSGQINIVNILFNPLLERVDSSKNTSFQALILNCYAYFLDNAGLYKNASETSKKAVDLSVSISGKNNLETIEYQLTHAINLAHAGLYQESYNICKHVYEERKRILGNEHLDTISAMKLLANSLNKLGRYKEALPLQDKALEIRKRELGEIHPGTIEAMNDLAGTYEDLGQYDKAIEIYKTILPIQNNILGEDHPDTITIVNNLAICLNKLMRTTEALSLRKAILKKRQKVLGEDHPETIAAMHNLACSYNDLEMHEEALPLREKVLANWKENLGENHPYTIQALKNLTLSLNKLGRYDEALSLAKKAYLKCKVALGDNHAFTFSALNHIVFSYYLNGKYKEGMPYLKQLKQLIDIGSITNPRDIIAYEKNIAHYYAKLGDHESALSLINDFIEKANKFYPDSKRILADCYDVASKILTEAGNHNEATLYAIKNIELRKNIQKESHVEVIDLKKMLP